MKMTMDKIIIEFFKKLNNLRNGRKISLKRKFLDYG
jgi:hypothetical protein